MKHLFLGILVLGSLSSFASDICNITTARTEIESRKIDGCINAITINGKAISKCYSSEDVLNGVVSAKIKELTEIGVCSSLPKQSCSVILSKTQDRGRDINGCIAAIVKNKKVVSKCLSEADLQDIYSGDLNYSKTVDKEFKSLVNRNVCLDLPLYIYN